MNCWWQIRQWHERKNITEALLLGKKSPVLLCEHNPTCFNSSICYHYVGSSSGPKPREASRAAAAGGAVPGLNTQELKQGCSCTDLTPPLPTSCHLGVGTVAASRTAGNPSARLTEKMASDNNLDRKGRWRRMGRLSYPKLHTDAK